LFKDIATLIYLAKSVDSEGFPTETPTNYEVFVEKKSIKRSEFYASMQAGMKPSIAFNLRIEDFEATKHIVDLQAVYATKITYDGATYDILRDYSVDDAMTELTCGKAV